MSRDDDAGAPKETVDASVDPAPDAGLDASTDASADAASSDAADSAPPGPYFGQVVVSHTLEATPRAYVNAGFYEFEDPGNCTRTTYGACTVSDCGRATHGGPVHYATAGDLYVNGLVGITLTTQASYTDAFHDGRIFQGGTPVHIRSTGGEVPAFGDHTVIAPADLSVQSPALGSTPVSLSRERDLAVTWYDGSAGYVSVFLDAYDTQGTRSVSIYCKGVPSDGRLVVPAAAMSRLMPVDGTNIRGSISVLPVNQETLWSGIWFITLNVEAAGASGSFTTAD